MSVNPVVFTSTGRPLPFDPATFNMTSIIEEALNKPGLLSEAYSRFHGYSLGNRWAVLIQCIARGIEAGPFASYRAWQNLDRQVKKGEKAMLVLHPMYRMETDEVTGMERQVLYGFTWKPTAFVMSQTDGEELELAERVPFDLAATLKDLNIKPVPFKMDDGNILGYATKDREISVSPLSPRPERTLFHEVGHIILGHVEKGTVSDGQELTRNTQEVEAELFSYLVCGCLEIDMNEKALAESRGYIQHWLKSKEWKDNNSRRVMTAVDRFLKLTKKSESTSKEN